MTLKKRIYLVITGAIVFILTAPVILLVANGYRYDFGQNRIIKTGTLVVRSAPRDAVVTLNHDGVSATTPVTKRFLLPGRYEITITKDGYRPWHKSLTISEGLVTFVPKRDAQVPLILSSTVTTLISTTTRDLLDSGNGVFALDQNAIWSLSSSAPSRQAILSTTTLLQATGLAAYQLDGLGEPNFLLDAQASGWHLRDSSFNPIESGQNRFLDEAQAVVGLLPTGELLRTIGTESFALDTSVLGFSIHGGQIYYLRQGENGGAGFWRVDSAGLKSSIVPSLPEYSSAQIIFTDADKIFLILDRQLFSIEGTGLNPLPREVDSAFWQAELNALVLKRGNEIWLYDITKKESFLVYKGAEALGEIVYNAATNYFFTTEGRNIIAIEVDAVEKPNIYVPEETDNPNPKFAVNQDGSRLYYLDGTDLMGLQIR